MVWNHCTSLGQWTLIQLCLSAVMRVCNIEGGKHCTLLCNKPQTYVLCITLLPLSLPSLSLSISPSLPLSLSLLVGCTVGPPLPRCIHKPWQCVEGGEDIRKVGMLTSRQTCSEDRSTLSAWCLWDGCVGRKGHT